MPHNRVTQLFTTRSRRFEALVRPHMDRLYRFALRMARDRSRAEDLVQSLFVKLYPRLEELEALDKPGPWLARALHNLYVDELRAGNRSPLDLNDGDETQLDGWPAAAADAPEAVVERMFERQRLLDALARIGPEQRAVVVWHDIEGYTLEELSRQHDIALGTLKSRLHRARAQLRKLLVEPERTEPETASERVDIER